MFLTLPTFEQWVPPALGPEGGRYWAAMTLTSGLPWYLLTHRFTMEEGYSMAETLVVSWESTLRSLVEGSNRDSIVSVHLMSLGASTGDWSMKRIAQIWQASPDEQTDTGPLLFRFQGEPGLWDSHQRAASGQNSQRRLLAQLS